MHKIINLNELTINNMLMITTMFRYISPGLSDFPIVMHWS